LRVELSELTEPSFRLCDAFLEGFSWLNDGHDVRLDLTNGFQQAVQITCRWVTNLQIELKPNPKPFSWECSAEKVGDRWHLLLDFASTGSIQLECESAILESATGD